MLEPNSGLESIVVHLLDPTYLRPVKSWRFSTESRIAIGRGDDCHVELNDPYVSRLHVELCRDSVGWTLIARGRNGVSLQGKQVEQVRLPLGEVFRLGANGPLLKCDCAEAVPVSDNENPATLCFETSDLGLLLLDSAKVDREVREIASGDYFQTLQAKARDLRRQRESAS